MTQEQLTRIKLLYKNKHGYADIGRIFGVSRQRIHQIIKGYRNFGKHGRLKKYDTNAICAICKQTKAQHLHHIDGNNKNDTKENLLPICVACHYKIHKGRKYATLVARGKWTTYHNHCKVCKSKNYKHQGHGLCVKCYYQKYTRASGVEQRKKERTKKYNQILSEYLKGNITQKELAKKYNTYQPYISRILKNVKIS